MFGFPPLDYSLHIVQLTSFGFSAGRVVQNHRRNIMKLCVIYGESMPFVRHIGFSVVNKKSAYHSAGSNVRDFWLWEIVEFVISSGNKRCFVLVPSLLIKSVDVFVAKRGNNIRNTLNSIKLVVASIK